MLIGGGLTTESALVKRRQPERLPSAAENFSYLQKLWEQEKMQSFKDILCSYSKKDVVSTMENMQKMVEFNHKKGIDILKLECTLLNLANICLYVSTSAKFYPLTDNDKGLLSKIRDDIVGRPSIV